MITQQHDTMRMEAKCPVCGKEIAVLEPAKEWEEECGKVFVRYYCNKCDSRIEIATRPDNIISTPRWWKG